MIAREAVLNDPEVVKLLKGRFVCLGVDNVQNPNMTEDEKRWLSDKGGRACTQGMSVFTAGGKVLGLGGGFEPKPVLRMLKAALEKYEPEEGLTLRAPTEAERSGKVHRPPEGGLVLYVSWKALGLDKATTAAGRHDEALRRSLGVDRLWARKDEAAALAKGELPESFQRRLLPHVGYALGGKVRKAELTLKGGRLTGSVVLESGARADVFGYVEAKGGKVTRFDVVARGTGGRVRDFGFSAGLAVVPEGKRVPVAVAFTLADPAEGLARVPPHRARDAAYLR